MHKNRSPRHLTRLTAGAVALASASLLLAGTLATPAGAVVGPPFHTVISVTSNGLNLVSGQSATFTAKAVASGHGTPGGQFTFTITGSDASTVTCDGGNTVAFTGGTATCTVAAGLLATGGPYTVSAAYVDTLDTTYQAGTGTRVQNVNKGKTTTTVTPTPNPSVTGQAISFTAAVAPFAPATGTPSGTVTFAGVTCDGGSNVIALSGGLATCTVAAGLVSKVGTYAITGAYSGDALFLSSSGTGHQSVKSAALAVTLVPSAGTCSGDICSIGQGTPMSFTATAAPGGTDGGSGVPSGTVTFSITRPGSNVSLACDGGTNTFTLAAGQGTCTLNQGLWASIYFKVTASVTATGFTTASSSLFENCRLTSTNLATSVPKNIATGQTFDVTAVVTPAVGYTGTNVPNGYVNILVCGNNSNGNLGCQGGAVPVGAGGVATLTIGGGEYIGDYSYQAVYTGDSNFYSSTARSKYFFVGKDNTQLILSEPGGFASFDGAAVAITATVDTGNVAGSTLIGPPTGSVTFTITGPNGTVDCAGGNTIALAQDLGQVEGSVSCFLPPGTLVDATPPETDYSIQASYSGDADYGVSNARAVQVVVPPIV
jgi:large repetitive protein